MQIVLGRTIQLSTGRDEKINNEKQVLFYRVCPYNLNEDLISGYNKNMNYICYVSYKTKKWN